MPLPLEMQEHIKIIKWFRLQYPQLKKDFHHFANERKCTPRQGKLLKDMGVQKGIADFHLAIPSSHYILSSGIFPYQCYHGLWLEFKVGNGKLTIEQKEFLENKKSRGYMAIAVWGFDATIEVIKKYLEQCII